MPNKLQLDSTCLSEQLPRCSKRAGRTSVICLTSAQFLHLYVKQLMSHILCFEKSRCTSCSKYYVFITTYSEKKWIFISIFLALKRSSDLGFSCLAFTSKLHSWLCKQMYLYFLIKILTEVGKVRVNSTCWCVGLNNFKWEQWVGFQDPFHVRFEVDSTAVYPNCSYSLLSVFQLHILPRYHNITAQGEYNWMYPHNSQGAWRSNLCKITESVWQGQENYMGATGYQSRR